MTQGLPALGPVSPLYFNGLSLTPGTRLALRQAQGDLEQRRKAGVYQITAQIGEGGMGEVYRATDTNLKRQVAIKVLPAAALGAKR